MNRRPGTSPARDARSPSRMRRPPELVETLCKCLTKPAVEDQLAGEVALCRRRCCPESLPKRSRPTSSACSWPSTRGTERPEGPPRARRSRSGSDASRSPWASRPSRTGSKRPPGPAARAEVERTLAGLSLRDPADLGWLLSPTTRTAPVTPSRHLDARGDEAFAAHCFDALAHNAGLPADTYRARTLERLENALERL